ncbi:uncharacterized protein LOC21395805 isoform X2 [Morus notabilis]|uniref:uncharacterized protein LOC21395805 isoform X2 n=1 Tax=Morus notabilis TaxID=981085 RepID=UPI000CED19CB|nr:uncharacterized protein LOC21395805 isoform X2 [Morus notabilis]
MATLNARKLWPTIAIAPSPSLIVLLKVSPSLSFHFQPDHNQNSYHLGRVLSESAMGKEPEITVEEGCRCSNGVHEFVSKKRLADDIIPQILNLYASSATPRDFEIYAPDASFEDPLMCARGVKQIKSAFYSLSKVFGESRIVEYSVEEKLTSPGKGEILIDNKQYYKFWGRNIDVISLIKLYVADGKVVRHEDCQMIKILT